MSDELRDQGQLDPAFQPEDVRLIGDVESLRAISDPTRLRILETMVQRQDPAWSVKELAAEIGVPQTRLYHHVEQLVERDLIRAVERRIVSGIIETRYRVVARSFQLDRRLLASDSESHRQVLHDTLRHGLRHRPQRDRGVDPDRASSTSATRRPRSGAWCCRGASCA